MEFPATLREIVAAALEGVPLADLQRASERLSQRYRGEVRDGALHLVDDLSARAYLAVRLPATYAAVRASLAAASELMPDFAPSSLLDAGAGPGTALLAARDCWPQIADAELIEASSAIRHWGQRIVAATGFEDVRWHADNLASVKLERKFDLVTMGYLLDELPPAAIAALIERLWQATSGVLIAVEPGTPSGWRRILSIRKQLIGLGAHVVAPCPHALACPLVEPDWCHFAQRVQRSRMHRRIKSADVPWEDEKFIYLAVAREPVIPEQARVIAPPAIRGGTVRLTLCNCDGTRSETLISRRDGDRFANARRLGWGDLFMAERE
jgi:ribosomal protein RSM22 (predicted rRNA methylase)